MTLNDFLFVTGLIVIVVGFACIYAPAALIVGGMALAALAYRLDA